ncbi:hypothetical protein GCM10011356_03860 [Kangiella profundi]|nr:hypothetical protein GCM10011356_03860 [Kangiella profundi]
MNYTELKYPAVCYSENNKGELYAFGVWSYEELIVCPFHSYLSGLCNSITLVDSDNKTYELNRRRITGISWVTMNQYGFVTSVLASIFSGFNFPVKVHYCFNPINQITIN